MTHPITPESILDLTIEELIQRINSKEITESKLVKDLKISDKHITLCKEYCRDFNGARAGRDAGYSHKTASEQVVAILAKLSIQAFLYFLKAKNAIKFEVKIEKEQADLQLIKEHCMTVVDDKMVNPAAAIKATETLLKTVGGLVDKKQIEHSGVVYNADYGGKDKT